MRPTLRPALLAAVLTIPSAAAAADGSPDAVVVTATRRAEPWLKVPGSVGVVPGEALRERGAGGYGDYLPGLPGVAYRDQGPGRQNIVIRGITAGADPVPVTATYLGDLPLGTTLANPKTGEADLRPADLERVEVLRGPQGTLFGALAMGGAVRLVPAAPDAGRAFGRASLSAGLAQGGAAQGDAEAVANQPLGDGSALRAVAYVARRDGTYANAFPGAGQGRVGDLSTEGGRVAWRAGVGRVSLTLSGAAQATRADGIPQADAPGFAGTPATLGPRGQYRATPEALGDRVQLAALTVEADLGGAGLAATSGFLHRLAHVNWDLSPVAGYTALFPTRERNRNRQWTQEVRLSSPGDGATRWQAGVFLSRQRQAFTQAVAVPPGPDGSALLYVRDYALDQGAAFAQASQDLGPDFTVGAGLRWTRLEQEFDEAASGFLNGGSSATSGGRDKGTLTPRLDLAWRAAPGLSAYAVAARGFRPGLLTGTVPTALCGPVATGSDPDSLWSYEAGVKLERAGLRLSAAAFLADWRRIQGLRLLGCGFSVPENFGRARSRGLEAEAAADLGGGFSVEAGVAFTDATLRRDNPNLGAERGDRLPNVPRFQARGSLAWEGSAWATPLSARVDGRYVGTSHDDFAATPAYRSGGYALLDAALSAGFGPVTATLAVENALDRAALLSVSRNAGTGQRTVARPRAVVARATAWF